ncbi:hypothetical protein BH10CYA1_BH10CYA1_48340 [soil metagenome]
MKEINLIDREGERSGEVQSAQQKLQSEATQMKRQAIDVKLEEHYSPTMTPEKKRFDSNKEGIAVRASAAPLDDQDWPSNDGFALSKFLEPLDHVQNAKLSNNLHEMIDSLIEISITTGKPLKDVRIISHGSTGAIYFPNYDKIDLGNSKALAQFAKLRPYLAPGAEISFHGCEIASNAFGESRMQDVADATGASVTAYKWKQCAYLPGIGPAVTKQPGFILAKRMNDERA